jgi:shikimate dehydrogenase
MAKYGLIGKNISYSFSKSFFTEKFRIENRKDTYENFDIQDISLFPDIIRSTEGLKGLNVTVPYKESIIPFLDGLDKEAERIGAVNTIKIKKDGRLIGYNSDHFGFAKAIEDFFPFPKKTALVLGSGGASKAVRYVLDTMSFEYTVVSRRKTENALSYEELTQKVMEDHLLIINCTPVGTFPNITAYPHIPYQYISHDHMLFDLIYNPDKTEFLKLGFASGARISNGLKMLEQQALKSWSIWKS